MKEKKSLKSWFGRIICLISVFLMGANLIADNAVLYEFDDIAYDDNITTADDTGTPGTYDGNVNNDSSEIKVIYNDFSGKAISIPYNSTTGSIDDIDLEWGTKIILEARIWKGDEASGTIDLIKNKASGDDVLRWYIDSNDKMVLHLKDDDGTDECIATSNAAVIEDEKWYSLRVVIDLTKTTVGDAVKMYATEETPDGGGAFSSSNYFGDGSDTTGETTTISSNTNLTSTTDGDIIVMNYKNLTIDSGATLTTSNRCRGLVLFVDGDLTVNGTISMTARGAHANPADSTISANTPVAPGDGNAVGTNGIRIPFYTENDTDTDSLTAAEFQGCGTALYNLITEFPALDGNGYGKIITIARSGAAGGAAVTTAPANGNNGNSSSNSCGGGGSGGDGHSNGNDTGAGATGTCFSGGGGGGGAYGAATTDATSAASYGGAGGDGDNYTGTRLGGAGAGNPAGSNSDSAGPAENGTGGLLVIICSGNITVGSSGKIESNGSDGGDFKSYGGGGGGSGGGAIVVAHGGTYTNSGTVEAVGGNYGNGTGAYHGGLGGAGSIQTLAISTSTGSSASGVFVPAPINLSASNTFEGDFATGTATLSATDDEIEMLDRSASFALKADFIKITPSASFTTFDEEDFHGLDTASYISPNASASLLISPSELLKRVVNPPTDFTNGVKNESVTVAYDDHPTTESVFHGMFEINFALKTEDFNGSLYVDIYIKKPGDSTFKKIGQVSTGTPPGGTDPWVQTFYWDSRSAAYDWTTSDAVAYRTSGPVKFKFEVR